MTCIRPGSFHPAGRTLFFIYGKQRRRFRRIKYLLPRITAAGKLHSDGNVSSFSLFLLCQTLPPLAAGDVNNVHEHVEKGPPLNITPLLLVHIVLHQPSHPRHSPHAGAQYSLRACVLAPFFFASELSPVSLFFGAPPSSPNMADRGIPPLHSLFKGRRDRLRRCHGYSRGRV